MTRYSYVPTSDDAGSTPSRVSAQSVFGHADARTAGTHCWSVVPASGRWGHRFGPHRHIASFGRMGHRAARFQALACLITRFRSAKLLTTDCYQPTDLLPLIIIVHSRMQNLALDIWFADDNDGHWTRLTPTDLKGEESMFAVEQAQLALIAPAERQQELQRTNNNSLRHTDPEERQEWLHWSARCADSAPSCVRLHGGRSSANRDRSSETGMSLTAKRI